MSEQLDIPMARFARRMTLTLDDGFPMSIVYTSPLSSDELRDVTEVMAIILRQLGREAKL